MDGGTSHLDAGTPALGLGIVDRLARLLTGPHPTGRAAGLLVGLCLLVFLPGFLALPPVDRDESRFAQASRQMFESVALPEAQRDPALHGGGLVLPRVQGRNRLTKPPLIYWLQAGAAAALTGGEPLRDAIWMYRVPSLLAAIVSVLATWRLGVSMFGGTAGLLAGVLLAVCPVVVWEAHQARADMVLLACTTVTMLGLWKVYQRRDRKGALHWALLFWLALSAGAMTKGPITPMVALLTVLALCTARRGWRWVLALRPVVGLLILAAAVVPWVWAVASRVGWENYWAAIYDETIGRSLGTKEGHWGPPGYHTVLMVVMFWPGSMLTGLSLVTAWKRVRRSRDPVFHSRDREGATTPSEDESHSLTLGARSALPFLLAWLVPSWIVFEIVTTKLPHYTLPLYPGLALVSAWGLCEVVAGRLVPRGVMVALGARAWLGMTLGLYTALPTALVFVDRGLPLQDVPFFVGFLGGLAFLLSFLYTLPRAPLEWRYLQTIGIVAAAVTLAVTMFLLPITRKLWITPALARGIPPNGPVASVGYHEDSLVFATRGRVEMLGRDDVGAWRMAHPEGGTLVLPSTYVPAYPGGGGGVTVEGFNYSRGRMEQYWTYHLDHPVP